MRLTRATRPAQVALYLLAFGLAGLGVNLSLAQLVEPAARPSAITARNHVAAIAQSSRASGLPGHDRARDYIVHTLSGLGLEPQLQRTSVINRFEHSGDFLGSVVENVWVRIPGTAPTGAIVIDAHYDSGATGPGAADCGTCVAAALEVARVVATGPRLRNDIIVLFADAEEMGDLGARAWADAYARPLNVRVAIALEGMGTTGPSALLVTGPGASGLVDGWAAHHPRPLAWSALQVVRDALPTAHAACDAEEFIAYGIAGAMFMHAGTMPSYHTRLDRVDRVSAGSLQGQIDHGLAVVRGLGDRDLQQLDRTESVYFTALPGVVVQYEVATARLLAALTVLGAIVVLVIALVRHRASVRGLVAGAAIAAGALAVGSLASIAVYAAALLPFDHMRVLLVGHYGQAWLTAGVILVGAGATWGWLLAFLRRPERSHRLCLGALAIGTVVLATASLLAPQASYLIQWPVAALLAVAAVDVLRAPFAWTRAVMVGAATMPASIVVLPIAVYMLAAILARFEGLSGLPLLGALGVFAAWLVVMWMPLVTWLATRRHATRARYVAPALLLAGLGVGSLGVGVVASRFDAAHPRPDSISYELDADTGAASWVSGDRSLDAWTAQLIPAATPVTQSRVTSTGIERRAPAPHVAVAPPAVDIITDTPTDRGRRLALVIRPARGGWLRIAIEARGSLAGIHADGVDILQDGDAAAGRFALWWFVTPARGLVLELVTTASEPLALELTESTAGLPLEVAPRPASMMPAPGGLPDATTVITRRAL